MLGSSAIGAAQLSAIVYVFSNFSRTVLLYTDWRAEWVLSIAGIPNKWCTSAPPSLSQPAYRPSVSQGLCLPHCSLRDYQ